MLGLPPDAGGDGGLPHYCLPWCADRGEPASAVPRGGCTQRGPLLGRQREARVRRTHHPSQDPQEPPRVPGGAASCLAGCMLVVAFCRLQTLDSALCCRSRYMHGMSQEQCFALTHMTVTHSALLLVPSAIPRAEEAAGVDRGCQARPHRLGRGDCSSHAQQGGARDRLVHARRGCGPGGAVPSQPCRMAAAASVSESCEGSLSSVSSWLCDLLVQTCAVMQQA